MTAAEFRTDIWTGRQVIVAGGRANRPQTAGPPKSPLHLQDQLEAKLDPFAEGREVDTPSESIALRLQETTANQPGWLLRVVANRYPAVALTTDSNSTAAMGIHDVIIECPDFRRCWLQFSVSEIARVLTAWQKRQRQLIAEPGIRSIQTFRNQGSAAGASLGHSHSQIVALHTIPKLIERRLKNAEGFRTWLASELAAKSRVVFANQLCVICPEASWVAGHLRICPTAGDLSGAVPFHELPSETTLDLAEVIQKCIRVVKATFPDASFNVVLNQPPIEHFNAFFWSIDVMPRTASFAGFELGCDVPIITTSPESAAESYRRAWVRVPNNSSHISDSADSQICPSGYLWRACKA